MQQITLEKVEIIHTERQINNPSDSIRSSFYTEFKFFAHMTTHINDVLRRSDKAQRRYDHFNMLDRNDAVRLNRSFSLVLCDANQ